jgi:hypothetical protein
MAERAKLRTGAGWALATLLLAGGALAALEKTPRPPFRYVGGTENLAPDSEGNLELGQEGMSFRCPGGAVEIPYASITRMEYRSDISSKVSKLKVRWKLRPSYSKPLFAGRRHRFFAVVYRADDATHVLVLRVPPGLMRPYLAEIDLKAERRVEVENLEDY